MMESFFKKNRTSVGARLEKKVNMDGKEDVRSLQRKAYDIELTESVSSWP